MGNLLECTETFYIECKLFEWNLSENNLQERNLFNVAFKSLNLK